MNQAPYHRIDFNPTFHQYKIDGVIVPSVTQIINVDTRYYNKKGADRGSKVHLLTQMYDEGDLELVSIEDTEYYNYVSAWVRFRTEQGFRPDAIEYIVGSKDLGCAGTVDRVGPLNGDYWLLDIKSGQPAKWHKHQLSGYKLLHKNSTLIMEVGKLINKLGCVYLSKTGKYKLEEYEYDPHGFLELRDKYEVSA